MSMNWLKTIITLVAFFGMQSLAWATQTATVAADKEFLQSEHKAYTVVIVAAVIVIGIAIYMLGLGKKIKHLEQEMAEKDNA